MKDFRKFTHSMPLAERTTVLFNERGFANTPDEKLAMARAAQAGQKSRSLTARRDSVLRAAWPGTFATHVFTVTPEEVIEALAPKPTVKVGDLVKLVKPYGGTTAPQVGAIGVVRSIDTTEGPNSRLAVGIEWANYTRGHSLDNKLDPDSKSGWNVGFANIGRA
jgi:hypothetical protein